MKYLLRTLIIMLSVMTWMSCSDDEPDTQSSSTGDIEMALKVTYDGAPLVLLQDVAYPDGKVMYFSKFSFYMSDLSLNSAEGNAISESSNYLRVGQAHNSALSAEEGLKFNLSGVQPADYTSLAFDIGVPADDNAKEPSDFTSTNDLSLSGEYWDGWSSYVFCKVEGVIDFDDDGIPETSFILHLGADPAFTNIDLEKSFIVTADQTTEVVIPIELKNLFQNGSEIFDIEASPSIESLSQSDLIDQLMTNMKTCFE